MSRMTVAPVTKDQAYPHRAVSRILGPSESSPRPLAKVVLARIVCVKIFTGSAWDGHLGMLSELNEPRKSKFGLTTTREQKPPIPGMKQHSRSPTPRRQRCGLGETARNPPGCETMTENSHAESTADVTRQKDHAMQPNTSSSGGTTGREVTIETLLPAGLEYWSPQSSRYLHTRY